jgi:BirA family biotin operon repressor/biotin-[acetyl-CoA-carboxylase] ligase
MTRRAHERNEVSAAWEIPWHALCTPRYNPNMLDQTLLEARLPIHGLGKPLHFYRSIGSTNAMAAELVESGAPHGTLVVAEEQTAGRGRGGRRWLTPAGAGIAFSLILRWDPPGGGFYGSLSVLGALGVAEAAEGLGIRARIKWPNDVLADGRKVAGVLVEAQWQGSKLSSAVVGIGVNVRPGSVPPPEEVDYPAGCLDDIAGGPTDPNVFLIELVRSLGLWSSRLGSPQILQAWESRLAFMGEQVGVVEGEVRREGRLVGLDMNGNLILQGVGGDRIVIGPTAADLRPIDSRPI